MNKRLQETPAVLQDRRKPVARYVEFGDADTQERFIDVAEAAYQALVAADTFEGHGQIEVRTAPAPEKKLFRKAQPAPSRMMPTTPALSRAVQTASAVRAAFEAPGSSCRSSLRVAQGLSTVLSELALDLLQLTPAEQAGHPAYRQTLRLAAELSGLRDVHAEPGCTNPDGCVGIRLPEHWGRRIEDVEVAEVRSVLHKLHAVGNDGWETETA
ncbi:MAG TPA: hypothetical protein VFK41_02410 [Nocardioidaceae bacterium]|nr:hypothetical protein [Nocardioidaceae bacterium]